MLLDDPSTPASKTAKTSGFTVIKIKKGLAIYKQARSPFWYVRCYMPFGGRHNQVISTKTDSEREARKIAEDFYVECAVKKRALGGDLPSGSNPAKDIRFSFASVANDFLEDRKRYAGNNAKHLRNYNDIRKLVDAKIPVSVERIERYKKNNVKFEVSEDGLSFRKWVAAKKKRPAHWDGWRSEPMPSISYGWGWVRKEITFQDKDGKDAKRHIKEVALSPDLRDNPSVAEKWNAFSSRVTGIYRKLSFDDFVKQAKFMRSWVPQKYHLGGGLFTTMSIQKYGDEMSAMGFHIDSGDENSGLTTITVVDEGSYEGGYFVLPRYRVAFRVGDGDVFVANSRQVHGVSALEGSGKRLSVVSYSKTAIGRRARMNAYAQALSQIRHCLPATDNGILGGEAHLTPSLSFQ